MPGWGGAARWAKRVVGRWAAPQGSRAFGRMGMWEAALAPAEGGPRGCPPHSLSDSRAGQGYPVALAAQSAGATEGTSSPETLGRQSCAPAPPPAGSLDAGHACWPGGVHRGAWLRAPAPRGPWAGEVRALSWEVGLQPPAGSHPQSRPHPPLTPTPHHPHPPPRPPHTHAYPQLRPAPTWPRSDPRTATE